MKYVKSFKFWILFLVVTYTAIGFLFLPWFLVNKAPQILKEKIGINLKIAKAEFNPYSFELTLHHVVLDDLHNKPVLSIKRFYTNYTLLGLFNKTLLVNKIELNAPKLYVTFQKDGILNLSNIIQSTPTTTPKTQTSESTLPNITLNALNMTEGSIVYQDQRNHKNFQYHLGPYHFVARDISTQKDRINSYSFQTTLHNKGSILWKGGMGINPFKVYGVIQVKDLNLVTLYHYALPDMKASLTHGTLDLKLPYQIIFHEGMKVNIDQANATLSQLIMTQKDNQKTLIDAPKLEVKGVNLKWPKQSLFIDQIHLNDTHINPVLQKNAQLNFMTLLASQEPSKTAPKPQPAHPAKPWEYGIHAITTHNLSVNFIDETLNKPLRSQLHNIQVTIKNFSSKKTDPIGIKLSATLNQKTDINATSTLIQTPLSSQSSIQLSHFRLSDFHPYLDPFINFKIKNADVDVNATLKTDFDSHNNINLLANTKIYNLLLQTTKGANLLKWNDLQVQGIKYSNHPLSVTIKNMRLLEPYISGEIYKNHTSNFSNLIKSQPQSESSTTTATDPSLQLKIGPIKILNATADFGDASLPFPFKTHIHNLNGSISTLDFGATTPSKVNIDGKIDKYGYANIKGVILPFQFKKRANIDVLFKNINLTTLTPYSGKFLGYKIKSGKLSMNLNYKIDNASLIGSNKINIDTLNLGQPVKSKDAVNLPLNLAIALLKDSNGQIDIDLPVSGDMNNPDFSYGGIVWRAVGNMITGLVTAPFRFLGSLLGIKGDDLKMIDFEQGSAIIISTEYEKLDNLHKILNKRPNIRIELSGGYDEEADLKALQKEAFDHIMTKHIATLKKDSKHAKEDLFARALTQLFIKDFGEKKYQELKTSFMVIPKTDDNTTRRSKKGKKATLDILKFNAAMQTALIAKIKIDHAQLVTLANQRAENIKKILVTKYKIKPERIIIKPAILQQAKRDMWVSTKVDISI
ncbi:DUF748 domain-containing protein [Sulfurospirillum sp. 1612]|uniref:DUF748 domain-containing protein n=1 Tax=Sulfurospirillum sp. 1612 TaxID=3094835 RepID=UPI002F949AF2